MKALVGIKRVVDYTSQKIKVKNNAVDLTNTRMYINPFCEIAMQQAANLKAKKSISQITALSIGPKGQSLQVFREKKILWSPMALGADKAIYLDTDLRVDMNVHPLMVAKALAHFIKRDGIELVLLGKQSVDDDNNATGQLLGGLLDWPQATFASKVQIQGNRIKVTRQVDTGLQTIEIKSPAIITCDLRLNLPKIASLPLMMKAKKAPIQQIAFSSLGIENINLKIVQTSQPLKKKGGSMVKDIDQLLQKLQKQSKVL